MWPVACGQSWVTKWDAPGSFAVLLKHVTLKHLQSRKCAWSCHLQCFITISTIIPFVLHNPISYAVITEQCLWHIKADPNFYWEKIHRIMECLPISHPHMWVVGVSVVSMFEKNYGVLTEPRNILDISPDSKVHGANMGPTWVLSAPDGPHVGPMNLAIREVTHDCLPYHSPERDSFRLVSGAFST